MANAGIDQNSRATLTALSSTGDGSIVTLYANPTTHRLLVDLAGGSGTVSSVSVVSANGFAGTVATATTTPAITLTTTITGILQGNGTAISAASTTGTGAVVLATSPTITTPVIAQINDASARATLSFASIASAVNSLQVENSIAGQPCHLKVQGSDTNIPIHVQPKGTGLFVISDGTDATKRYRFDASGFTTSATLTFSGAITTARVITFPDATGTLLYSGGPLGTPSSGTVTNLTGTASININGTVGATTPAAGTFTTVTTSGNIELGNASDTTLSRAGGGIVAIEGTTINGYATTATAAGTTALTIASARTQFFTGSTTQTVTLPTTSVVVGQPYRIVNNSTGNVTVQSSGANTIQILGAGMSAWFTAIVATPTTAANWSCALQSSTGENIAQTASANAATVNLAYATNTITNNSAATLTVTLPTAGAIDGEKRMVRILPSSAVAQTLTLVNTENSSVTAPASTGSSTTIPIFIGFQYNLATTKWTVIASA